MFFICFVKHSNSDSVSEKTANNNTTNNTNQDDTDHDNDEFVLEHVLKPPPIPKSDPPPLPSGYSSHVKSSNSESSSSSLNKSASEDEIKKALLDNMKCVENWKKEQELLMKVSYFRNTRNFINLRWLYVNLWTKEKICRGTETHWDLAQIGFRKSQGRRNSAPRTGNTTKRNLKKLMRPYLNLNLKNLTQR